MENFRLKYSEKLYKLLQEYEGKKFIISVEDFRDYFDVPNMKTSSSMIQKIIQTSKAEFDELETLNFHFETLKKRKIVEFFIFYPYINKPIIFGIPSELIIKKPLIEIKKKNQIDESSKQNYNDNFVESSAKIEIKSEFDHFQNSQYNNENYEKSFNEKEIEEALEIMKKRRQNDA